MLASSILQHYNKLHRDCTHLDKEFVFLEKPDKKYKEDAVRKASKITSTLKIKQIKD